MNTREKLTHHNRIVVKVGTTTLTHKNGRLNLSRLDKIAWAISDLRNQGKEVVLVSSGAIGVGAERLGLSERPRDVKGKQAAAAVGQVVLMQIYQNSFMSYNQKVAQILLTKDVLEDKVRNQNAKNTFYTLLRLGVVPIVNENDTISTDELGFSENDRLSAYVASVVNADLLVILSDIEGLFAQDPKINPNAPIIRYVRNISSDMMDMAGGSHSSLGSGGMAAKLGAAKIAAANGIDTVIAKGDNPRILQDILSGQDVGTMFEAEN